MVKERVTVTLPAEILKNIDRQTCNRSKFILTAVQHELQRRRREELRRSLRSPHPESLELAELGVNEWASQLPDEAGADVLDPSAGKDIRWVPEEGWVEVED